MIRHKVQVPVKWVVKPAFPTSRKAINLGRVKGMANKRGLGAAIAAMFAKLFSEGATKPYDSVGGKGHYFEGNIGYKYTCRSNQSKRRKMERRVGHV